VIEGLGAGGDTADEMAALVADRGGGPGKPE
jgi:hypothetical protein